MTKSKPFPVTQRERDIYERNAANERWTASVRLDLPGSITLDEVDTLLERLREHAGAWLSQDGRSIGIQWNEANEWALRGVVEATIAETEANNPAVEFPDDRDGPDYLRWQGEAEPFA